MPRPELQAPPEIFYNETEARKYATSSRIIKIQAKISERALELLNLPKDGVPRLLLDIGCGTGLSGETLSEDEHHWIGFDISQSMLGKSIAPSNYGYFRTFFPFVALLFLLSDIKTLSDVALEREVDGDLLLADMGQV